MAEASADVIVIGGGVSGLAAAGALGRARRRVILLEARERLGGRIYTVRRDGWRRPIELGAEFVHDGNPPLWALLRNHGIRARLVPPHHWQAGDQRLEAIDAAKEIGAVTSKIDPRKVGDRSFAEFLRSHANEFPAAKRAIAAGFVEGFEAAPMDEMSARAIAGETLEEDRQFALPRGYDHVVAALIDELPVQYVSLRSNAVVNAVEWDDGNVVVRAGVDTYRAAAAVITVPLGVLQARPPAEGAIRFKPRLREKEALLEKMRIGHVIRITFRFDGRTWRTLVPAELRRNLRSGFGFIHSRVDGVPVWWSLSGAPVATGWAGGPAARAIADKSETEIRDVALRSLAALWRLPDRKLDQAVVDFATHNWSKDPFSRGAYSFVVAGLDDASEQLRKPVEETLFFGGEATADGAAVGTVHGALASGLRVAQQVEAAVRRNPPMRRPGKAVGAK